MIAYIKTLAGDAASFFTDDFLNKWHACAACLNAETGQSVAYDDHLRMNEIISTWMTSPKGFQAAMD